MWNHKVETPFTLWIWYHMSVHIHPCKFKYNHSIFVDLNFLFRYLQSYCNETNDTAKLEREGATFRVHTPILHNPETHKIQKKYKCCTDVRQLLTFCCSYNLISSNYFLGYHLIVKTTQHDNSQNVSIM